MTAMTFDTLKFSEHLIKAGIPDAHAKAIAEAQKQSVSEMLEAQLSTKADLLEMENRLIKWGVGLALGQTAIIAALVKIL